MGVFYTHANIILRNKKFATCFILANIMLLLLTFFEGGTISVVSASARSLLLAPTVILFAFAFPRVFHVSLFLDVVAVLRTFARCEIKAQSKPSNVDRPAPSSVGTASTFAGGECTLFDIGPSAFKTKRGRLDALTTSLLWCSECTSM